MHIESSQLVFSPSDFTQFMDSPFASWMEHLALTHPEQLPAPDDRDALGEVLQGLGNQHELDVLASFQEQGLTIVNVQHAPNPFKETLAAMQQGVLVVEGSNPSVPTNLRKGFSKSTFLNKNPWLHFLNFLVCLATPL